MTTLLYALSAKGVGSINVCGEGGRRRGKGGEGGDGWGTGEGGTWGINILAHVIDLNYAPKVLRTPLLQLAAQHNKVMGLACLVACRENRLNKRLVSWRREKIDPIDVRHDDRQPGVDVFFASVFHCLAATFINPIPATPAASSFRKRPVKYKI